MNDPFSFDDNEERLLPEWQTSNTGHASLADPKKRSREAEFGPPQQKQRMLKVDDADDHLFAKALTADDDGKFPCELRLLFQCQ